MNDKRAFKLASYALSVISSRYIWGSSEKGGEFLVRYPRRSEYDDKYLCPSPKLVIARDGYQKRASHEIYSSAVSVHRVFLPIRFTLLSGKFPRVHSREILIFLSTTVTTRKIRMFYLYY